VPAGPVPTGVDVVTTEAAERPGRPPVVQRSDAADVHSLQTLGALLGLELDALVPHQVTAAGALDRADVRAHDGRPVRGGDEAVALVGVEPGDDASSHGDIPSLS